MEATIQYGAPLRVADDAAVFKSYAKAVAHRRDLLLSFMARWSNEVDGQSGHLHLSLRDTRRHAGAARRRTGRAGLSADDAHMLGGHAGADARAAADAGAERQLVQAARAGHLRADRGVLGRREPSCALRVIPGPPAGTRVECRTPGADANPVLRDRRPGRRGAVRHRAADRAGPPLQRDAYASEVPEGSRSRPPSATASTASAPPRSHGSCSATRSSTTTPTPASCRSASSAAWSRTASWSASSSCRSGAVAGGGAGRDRGLLRARRRRAPYRRRGRGEQGRVSQLAARPGVRREGDVRAVQRRRGGGWPAFQEAAIRAGVPRRRRSCARPAGAARRRSPTAARCASTAGSRLAADRASTPARSAPRSAASTAPAFRGRRRRGPWYSEPVGAARWPSSPAAAGRPAARAPPRWRLSCRAGRARSSCSRRRDAGDVPPRSLGRQRAAGGRRRAVRDRLGQRRPGGPGQELAMLAVEFAADDAAAGRRARRGLPRCRRARRS